jgi:hypothetical protein
MIGYGKTETTQVVNNTGGTRSYGELVLLDFKTTVPGNRGFYAISPADLVANSIPVVGIVTSESVADGGEMTVAVNGVVKQAKVLGISGTHEKGDLLDIDTTASQFRLKATGLSSPQVVGSGEAEAYLKLTRAICLETGAAAAANETLDVLLINNPAHGF